MEEADAGIQLGGWGELLVVLGEGADEGGVVGADGGDVGVFAGAELRVAVARGLGEGWSEMEESGKEEES